VNPNRKEADVTVLSLVSARIPAERRAEVVDTYRHTVEADLPRAIRQTFLLASDDGTVAVATVWRSREALDTVRSSPEEPFARRLLREAGGEPEARFFDVVVEAGSDAR
jgi:heme-degrading monooxygenase HmoA